jgi:hypothetical protein
VGECCLMPVFHDAVCGRMASPFGQHVWHPTVPVPPSCVHQCLLLVGWAYSFQATYVAASVSCTGRCVVYSAVPPSSPTPYPSSIPTQLLWVYASVDIGLTRIQQCCVCEGQGGGLIGWLNALTISRLGLACACGVSAFHPYRHANCVAAV